MGQCASQMCGTNIIKLLMEKYGDDFVKFISMEKAKIFIEERFDELKNRLTDKIGANKTQILTKLDDKQKELDQLVMKVRKNLDDIIPGGLESLEKIKGQPIQETLGYKEFKEKFKELKQTSVEKIGEQEKRIWSLADQKKVQAVEKIEKQQPRIPIYDDLSEKQQRVVFKEAEKRFEKQIKQKQDEVENENSGALDPENYLQSLKDILPAGSVDGVLGRAIEKFDGIAKKLQGGGLSDLAGKFF